MILHRTGVSICVTRYEANAIPQRLAFPKWHSATVSTLQPATCYERCWMQAGVSAQILLATGLDQYRKPEKGMYDYFVEHGNGGQTPGWCHAMHYS